MILLQCQLKMTNHTSSVRRGVLMILLMIWDLPTGTKQEEMVVKTFRSVNNVDIAENIGMSTGTQTVSTQMRCSSLCIEKRCQCTSFLYDNIEKECYMFSRTLTTGTGNRRGYTKITECATPRQIPHATLQTFTSCSATYGCNFGYNSLTSGDSNVITCQTDETWKPSDYLCVQIPCPSPPQLTNGHFDVTSHLVGGTATYACNPNAVATGGSEITRTCQLGGTWSTKLDIVCTLTTTYTIIIKTGEVYSAGTDANVFMILTSEFGSITIDFPTTMLFEQGNGDIYEETFPHYGGLQKVTIGHDNSNAGPGWYPDHILIKDSLTNEDFLWTVRRWIATDEPGSQLTLTGIVQQNGNIVTQA